MEHYASCTERAYGKAVLHLTSIRERHAITLSEIANAAQSQMSHCDCRERRLQAAEEQLRLARKSFRAGRCAQSDVDLMKARRDELVTR